MKLLKQKGFAALIIIFLVLTIIFSIVGSVAFLVFNSQRTSRNIIRSSQAYFLAEGGIEDALLKIKNSPSLSNFSYSFSPAKGNIEVNISENIGGSLTIISKGEFWNLIRKIKVVYQIDLERVSFFYGAQAGEGGIVMENNSKVRGNVFSNGSILGSNGAEITDSAIVAGEKIDNVKVGQDAKVYKCIDSQIQGDFFYVEEPTNCSFSGQSYQIDKISPADFPISEEAIEKWKTQAMAGDIISENLTISGNQVLGPAHIQGNLTLNISSNLKMQGTTLVSGDLIIRNNAVLDLDSDFYKTLSGVMIVEGKVLVRNGGIIKGSGQPGSYLMIISLSNSLTDAVQIDNTSAGGVFFAPYGAILLNQSIKIREATAYKIILKQTAEIEYEVGLGNVFFSSGTGGGWRLLSWQEIE